MDKLKWLDTHVHVSDVGPDGRFRPHLLEDLMQVLDTSDADLRWVISPDANWLQKIMQDSQGVFDANAFIHGLVRRAPGRLFGSCLVNPHFLEASLAAMDRCFSEWGFVQLGEMLQYIMNFRMDSAPCERLCRAAARYRVPVQVHISTSNSRQGAFASGLEELEDLLRLVNRVPQANYILAHAVGLMTDKPPIVDAYLDVIERTYKRWPENFWIEIRDFNSPGVRSVLARVPSSRIIAGTDWVSRVGPPFLPYGVVFGVKSVEENPYPPSVGAMVAFLRQRGASDAVISQIAYENAAALLRL